MRTLPDVRTRGKKSDFPQFLQNSHNNDSSKYENSAAIFSYASFLASTLARPSIAIKDTIVFDQYFGLAIIRIDWILVRYI